MLIPTSVVASKTNDAGAKANHPQPPTAERKSHTRRPKVGNLPETHGF